MEAYHVQALVPDLDTNTSDGLARERWTDVFDVPRGDTEMDELLHARSVRGMAERFYVNVRIVRRGPAGEDKIVR